MGNHNAKLYPEPDKKDALKMKEFFKLKYTQKRFAKTDDESESEEDSDDSSDSSSSEEDTKKKKKSKKSRKSTADAGLG